MLLVHWPFVPIYSVHNLKIEDWKDRILNYVQYKRKRLDIKNCLFMYIDNFTTAASAVTTVGIFL